jgi:hypothetical protein
MGAAERDAERDTQQQRAAMAAHDIPPGSLTICHAASTNKPKKVADISLTSGHLD